LENVRSEYRVLVDNLPSDAGWTELKNHIVKILQMKSSRDLFGHIYRDMDGRSLGYGFVEFGSFEEMKSAIRKLNNTEFFGRGLRFREDIEHPYPESDSKSKSSKRYQPYSPYDRKQKEDYREREKSDRYRDSRDYRDSYAPKGSHDRISREERDTSRDHHHVLNPEGLTSLFVGGVDNDIDEVQFRKCFDKFGTIVDIKLLRGKRCGFVQYAEHKEALKAVNEMNGALVGRYRIRVQWRVRKPAHIVAAEKSRLEALKRMNEQSERRSEQLKEQTNGKCANQV
jgi:RNA recognition motif-containing protein